MHIDTPGQTAGPPAAKRNRRRPATMTQHLRATRARAEVYRQHLGRDLSGKLVHHAEQMAHHHTRYQAELSRLNAAMKDVGIPPLQITEDMWSPLPDTPVGGGGTTLPRRL